MSVGGAALTKRTTGTVIYVTDGPKVLDNAQDPRTHWPPAAWDR